MSSSRAFISRTRLAVALAAISSFGIPAAQASCFWSHIDHEVGYNDTGVWAASSYRAVMDILTVAQIGGAFWEGADSRIGRTMWQGMDSEAIAAIASNGAKLVFTRERPDTNNDPCQWFKGGSNYSFPSGEASVAAALVTPYIIEYGRDHPAVYALLAIPAYVGVGRLKNHAHWQSDVITGWAIGGASGWYSHGRETPIFVSILPKGFSVGFRKSF
ncbi:MAG: phosphatase PAP2 family protein [Usitatibacter sp.]